MTENFKLKGLTKGMVIIVIVVHLMFFLLEAILWMQPHVYTILIGQLNNPVELGDMEQAFVLKNLFINQGFYNFFLVCTGLYGFYLVVNKRYLVGFALILVLCFFGMGAGVVLFFSTKAYILAFIQGASSALAFTGVFPMYKKLMEQSRLVNF